MITGKPLFANTRLQNIRSITFTYVKDLQSVSVSQMCTVHRLLLAWRRTEDNTEWMKRSEKKMNYTKRKQKILCIIFIHVSSSQMELIALILRGHFCTRFWCLFLFFSLVFRIIVYTCDGSFLSLLCVLWFLIASHSLFR